MAPFLFNQTFRGLISFYIGLINKKYFIFISKISYKPLMYNNMIWGAPCCEIYNPIYCLINLLV